MSSATEAVPIWPSHRTEGRVVALQLQLNILHTDLVAGMAVREDDVNSLVILQLSTCETID